MQRSRKRKTNSSSDRGFASARTGRVLSAVLPLVLATVMVSVQAAENQVLLTNERWARIGNTGEFVGIPGLKELVAALDQDKRSVIEVHYAGGESGQLWAQQFRNRLVALGVDSGRVELLQGSVELNVLQVRLGRLR